MKQILSNWSQSIAQSVAFLVLADWEGLSHTASEPIQVSWFPFY